MCEDFQLLSWGSLGVTAKQVVPSAAGSWGEFIALSVAENLVWCKHAISCAPGQGAAGQHQFPLQLVGADPQHPSDSGCHPVWVRGFGEHALSTVVQNTLQQRNDRASLAWNACPRKQDFFFFVTTQPTNGKDQDFRYPLPLKNCFAPFAISVHNGSKGAGCWGLAAPCWRSGAVASSHSSELPPLSWQDGVTNTPPFFCQPSHSLQGVSTRSVINAVFVFRAW